MALISRESDRNLTTLADPTDFGSGRSAARLARLLREQEVGSSNLPAPTTYSFHSAPIVVASIMLALVLVVVVPPALASSPANYTVRRGDNLSLIAQRFGTSVAELKQDNHLTRDVIHVGQKLQLRKPFSGMGNSTVSWGRPLRNPGPVLRPFGPYKAGGILMPRTGVEVSCSPATTIYSPAVGVVRFSGPMEGYGHLLIIEHPGRYATVLGPMDPAKIAVGEGEAILQGDRLGQSGLPEDENDKPYVHIELRRKDKAVPPDRLLN